MGMFDNLGKGQAPQNPMQMMSQLRSDPGGVLRQAGYSIPDGMRSPQEIVNHLLSSGQITNSRLSMAQQMAQTFKVR